MNPVAAIFDSIVLYRYSLVLALAAAAGICFFLACCSYVEIPFIRASAAVLTALVLSLPLSRLVYWYARPDSFASFTQAIRSSGTESCALAGVLAGCALSAILTGGHSGRRTMLDCMSVAGCGAIALGRLGCFFTETDRGQIMVHLTDLPWAYPVANASGFPEFRFATFVFQAAAAAVLGILLAVVFSKRKQPGNVTALFLLLYSASQVILDSTRYDSLYLRSNGFVSIVQLLAAAALAAVLILLSVRTVKILGMKFWMILLWVSLVVLFGCTGFAEYYVQRHGQEAVAAYSAMSGCLICIGLLGLLLWHLSQGPRPKTANE